MENGNIKSYSRQLRDFENSVILDKLADIDLDSEYSLYDFIINSFVNGDYDFNYNSSAFNGLTNEEQAELLNKGKQYIELCFAKGGYSNWKEYASNNFGGDAELCVLNVLKNFDSLLNILRYGGDDSLRMIFSFVDEKSLEEGSIFDKLRVYFPNNVILTQAMVELGQSTNNFSRYSNKYKKLLCEYADGILYKKENDSYSFRSALSIGLDISRVINGGIDIDNFNFDEYHNLISDEDTFVDALLTLSLENSNVDVLDTVKNK